MSRCMARRTYTGQMTAAKTQELQHLVDQLPPRELRRILRLVLGELEAARAREAGRDDAIGQTSGRRRHLSFVGIVEDEPDTARRSEEILRARFGQAT